MKLRKAMLILLCIINSILLISFAEADGIVVAFEKKEYTLLSGKEETIKPVIQGTKSKGKFEYYSSDEAIATVKNGKVKGIIPGDVMIKCTVSIDKEEYTCSYLLHVLQPVTQIIVPEKEMTLPAGAILRELPYTVIPDNAANKEIVILCDNQKWNLTSNGSLPIGDKGGKRKFTFKATDGSNIVANFKVNVPKGAWFSIESPVTIDDPSGVDFFYVPTYRRDVGILTIDEATTKGVVRKSHGKEEPTELLKNQPFYFNARGLTFSALTSVHLEPLKVGKGQFIVWVTGDKATLDVIVTRSAVYENVKYEQFLKNEEKNTNLRFAISGVITTIEESSLYISCDNDVAKQVRVIIPDTINMSSLLPGDSITMKGVFRCMEDYVTETGLTKPIPCFTAEHIE